MMHETENDYDPTDILEREIYADSNFNDESTAALRGNDEPVLVLNTSPSRILNSATSKLSFGGGADIGYQFNNLDNSNGNSSN